jgi:hypothetical protein
MELASGAVVFANGTSAAVIAATAAVFGGLVAAFANRGVERLRLRAGLVEKAQERRLATLERFLLATNAWIDWLSFLEDQGWTDESAPELNKRVKGPRRCVPATAAARRRQLFRVANDDLSRRRIRSEENLRQSRPKRDQAR